MTNNCKTYQNPTERYVFACYENLRLILWSLWLKFGFSTPRYGICLVFFSFRDWVGHPVGNLLINWKTLHLTLLHFTACSRPLFPTCLSRQSSLIILASPPRLPPFSCPQDMVFTTFVSFRSLSTYASRLLSPQLPCHSHLATLTPLQPPHHLAPRKKRESGKEREREREWEEVNFWDFLQI